MASTHMLPALDSVAQAAFLLSFIKRSRLQTMALQRMVDLSQALGRKLPMPENRRCPYTRMVSPEPSCSFLVAFEASGASQAFRPIKATAVLFLTVSLRLATGRKQKAIRPNLRINCVVRSLFSLLLHLSHFSEKSAPPKRSIATPALLPFLEPDPLAMYHRVPSTSI